MSGVSDKRAVTMRGWPAGVDNISPEQDLVRDDKGRTVIAVRQAINVDLSPGGKPRRREGRTRVLAGARLHSAWRDGDLPFALYVAAGALYGFQPGKTFLITDGIAPGLPVSYALVADRVFWSNGYDRGVVTANGSAAPWGCPTPQGQPTAAAITGQGGLDAGRYQVAVTWSLATGEESGAVLAELVEVEQGGGIQLTDFPVPPPEVARVRVYLSPANGDVLYHAQDLSPALPVAIVGAGRRGKPLDSQFLDNMPAGQLVRLFNGRLVIAADTDLCWSESLRYGLTHPANNRIGFGSRIPLLESVGVGNESAGMYVADAKRTYWLGGTDPSRWSQSIAYPHSAVRGSGLTVPGTVFGLESAAPVAYWLASNGVACLGLPGGQVLPLRENQAVAPDAKSAASLFRERNGMRHVVTAISDTAPRGMVMGDRAVTTIERYDA